MKQFQYKEWLFVEVPLGRQFEIIKNFLVIGVCLSDMLSKIAKINRGDTNGFYKLPSGQYSIVGKADEIDVATVIDINLLKSKFHIERKQQ